MSHNLGVENLTVLPHLAIGPVLRDISFDVPQGQRVLLLGPSGAGKSTLLLALSGVLANLQTAEITGRISADPAGLLLQNPLDATVGFTVFRDVAFGAESAGFPALTISELVSKAMTDVGLGHIQSDRQPQTLSGGELQRMCLAGLVALSPKVLLLDEPTAMLDAESAAQVRLAVEQYLLSSGATAIIAEHRFDVWVDIADRIIVLGTQGNILDDGPTNRILQDYHHHFLDWGLWVPGESAPAVESAIPTTQNGKITALIGPSGSGKTTVLNARLQELLADHGPTDLGWLPQNAGFTIAGPSVLASAGGTGKAEQLLADLGLEKHSSQNPHDLSGGEKRRLALASALLTEPKYLLLDEPTVGQDRKNWALVVNQILKAKTKGAQILLATHDAELIDLCDEVQQLETAPRHVNQVGTGSSLTVSPFGLLGASMILLAGSWLINSLAAALVSFAVMFWLALFVALFGGFNGRRPSSLKILLPAVIGIASIAVSNWWLSADHNWQPAAITALRVAFFVLPGVLLASQINPAQLADQAGQLAKLPARPVVAASVALQKVFDFQALWNQQVLVRKVRGLTKSNRVSEAGALTLGLLIEATRSATQVAIAMEARGYSATDSNGKRIKRTWAVPAALASRDWLLLAGAAASAASILLVR